MGQAEACRRAEWARLVEEIVPDFVDPVTEGPLPGKEERWSLVTEYRVRLAIDARDWESAQRLQELAVRWDRDRAVAALTKPPNLLDAVEKNGLRTLAVSLYGLAEIQREQGLASCAENYEPIEPIEIHVLSGTCQARGVRASLGQADHFFRSRPLDRDIARIAQALECVAVTPRLRPAESLKIRQRQHAWVLPRQDFEQCQRAGPSRGSAPREAFSRSKYVEKLPGLGLKSAIG